MYCEQRLTDLLCSYLNGVIGSVNTILKGLYAHEYATSNAQSNITSLVFAGEGMFCSLLL